MRWNRKSRVGLRREKISGPSFVCSHSHTHTTRIIKAKCLFVDNKEIYMHRTETVIILKWTLFISAPEEQKKYKSEIVVVIRTYTNILPISFVIFKTINLRKREHVLKEIKGWKPISLCSFEFYLLNCITSVNKWYMSIENKCWNWTILNLSSINKLQFLEINLNSSNIFILSLLAQNVVGSDEFDLTHDHEMCESLLHDRICKAALTDIMYVRRENDKIWKNGTCCSCEKYYHWYTKNTDWVGKVVTEIHNSLTSFTTFFFCRIYGIGSNHRCFTFGMKKDSCCDFLCM